LRFWRFKNKRREQISKSLLVHHLPWDAFLQIKIKIKIKINIKKRFWYKTFAVGCASENQNQNRYWYK